LVLVVDSQVHVWPADRPERRLDEGYRSRPPYTYGTLLAAMDDAGVDATILVPPSFDGDRNDYALEAASRHPDRFAVMGRVALQSGATGAALSRWKQQPGMLGVRLTFHRDTDRPWLTDGTADWFWPEAERHGIPVMVHAPERIATVQAIAARHPGLTVIYDHMGFARETTDDRAMARVQELLPLAKLPNVSVKVSALPCYSTEPYPFRNLREPLRTVIDAFGPRRSFWGSDITRVPPSCAYRQAVTHFTEELDFLSDDDLEWIMGKGLATCLNWPPQSDNLGTPRQ
jgi:predicted TIM-barrel fold metal-dependent hydrolase